MPPARTTHADRRALAALGGLLALCAALSWRRWGDPAFDAGNEMAVADLVAHGAVPYEDVRYYYGPLALSALAGTFRVAGTGLAVAWVFGWGQTVLLVLGFFVLARQWLRTTTAALAAAVFIVIGFSGSGFEWVSPHTFSATFGLLALLAGLLALRRGRLALAGLAGGALLLTRPEFALFGVVALAGAVVACARADGPRAAAGVAARVALPALLVAGPVLGALAAWVGTHRLFLESLYPVDFIRVAGGRYSAALTPFTPASLLSVAVRGLAVGALIAVPLLVRGGPRRRAAWLALVPLAAVLVVLDGAVRGEAERGLLAMSWLPAAALAGAGWAAWQLVRGRPRPSDVALCAAAVACALRGYADFTTDGPAVYYAPLPLLVAAIGLERLGDRLEARRRVVPLVVLAGMGLVLGLQGYAGRLRDQTLEVDSARGSYRAFRDPARALPRTLSLIERRTRPGQPILVLADDGGLHFLADRPPALRDLTFLPGNLAPASRERAAVARLRRVRPPLVVLSARRFDEYGFRAFGVDYDRALFAAVARGWRPVARFGDVADPPEGANLAPAFTVLARRDQTGR